MIGRAILLAALAWAGGVCAETMLIGSHVWAVNRDGFGGFSAIEVSPDRNSFVALTDRTLLVRGQFIRDDLGRITDVGVLSADLLRDVHGAPLSGERADSEGLAIGPDGSVWISFENLARVRMENGPQGLPVLLPRPAEFGGLQRNSALEALAIDAEGTLYTIPERSGRASLPFAVYRHRDGTWDVPFRLERSGSFLVVGADFGPDGQLYVLERDITALGFRSRVRRMGQDGGNPQTLLVTAAGTHDNLEGISVWQDEAGLRLTLISDDNFNPFQLTELVEYRVTD